MCLLSRADRATSGRGGRKRPFPFGKKLREAPTPDMLEIRKGEHVITRALIQRVIWRRGIPALIFWHCVARFLLPRSATLARLQSRRS